jgi:hypothetical protein
MLIDMAQLNPALAEDEEALKHRHETFKEYLLQLANSNKGKHMKISVNRVKKLLPRQTYYTKDYINKAIHINIPWILRGVDKFHRKIGSVKVGKGVSLPKTLIKGETPELKQLNYTMKKLDTDYYGLNSQHKQLATDVIKLTQEIRAAAETL